MTTAKIDISRKDYYRYAEDVISGKIVACKFVKAACQRFIADLTDERFTFKPKKVERCIKFIKLNRHFSGRSANQPFVLEPWQAFVVANIIGFYDSRTGMRRFNECYLTVARKNGKTALFAALMIYFLIADGEPDACVMISANSREQATRVDFHMIKGFLGKLDPKKRLFNAQHNQVVCKGLTNTMYVTASDASRLDGFSVSACLIDEYHEAVTSEVKDVFKTAMGNRNQPFMSVVTTRGFDMSKPCFALDQYAGEVAVGDKKDEALFSLIFTLDDGDDWRDPNVWAKANPNMGVTTSVSYIQGELAKAENSTSDEINFRTKLMNQWVESKTIWIADSVIEQAMQPFGFDKFVGLPCYVGLDLAAVSDLTSVCYMWAIDGVYWFKVMNYLPSDALSTKVNSTLYRQFDHQGELTIFPDSNVTDYDKVNEEIREVSANCPIYNISYDAWNSTQMIVQLTNFGFNCNPFSQSLSSFNRPTKEFERAILQGKVVIDASECVRWAFRNVLVKTDRHENQMLDKATPMAKIDPCVSMMMALGGYLTNGMPEFSGI